ncbi:AraC family transcriptional regulator [Agarivorans sp. OAG1]|uniref:AraC family transcriptional regulator n=1 Tax=Agarivorans sp. OAG1 TaxID=3082387 RepID=UPI002B298D9B|nr:AraC family transcriptional regulator [Agarivorans sp. OAG1]
MAKEASIAFGRSGIFNMFLLAVEERYGNFFQQVNLPQSLFIDPMRPMPLSEMTRYFGVLEQSIDDPLFVARASANIKLQHFPPLRAITQSTPTLFTAVRRMTALARIIQTGCKVRTTIGHTQTRWCYNTQIPVVSERLLDGIVAAWLFIHLLRSYLGADYAPDTLQLPGSRLGEEGEMESIFGCNIAWNSKQTEVHFPSEKLQHCIPINPAFLKSQRSNQVFSLDYIDLPEETDFARCAYELINYARAFGYPKLEFIADILMISPLTLQRKLQKEQLSFSELVKYQLLFNLAPEMLLRGHSEQDIASELGFSNPQSFSKAFKKAHQQTPRQYTQHLEDFL